MKKILLLTIAVFCSLAINAQWSLLNSGTTANFTSVSFPLIDTGYAVTSDYGIGGKIFATTDGVTWNQQYTTADYLLTVFFVSAKVGWAGGGIIGSNGLILKTTDGGLTWNPQAVSVQQIYSIYFTDELTGWAIGNDATQGTFFIYNTTNGGTDWNLQKTGSDYIRSIFFRNNQLGWIAGDNGRILNTTDGGLNWNLQNTAVVFHFNSIFFISDNVGWSVGSYINGGCYKTTDGGLSWNPQNIGTNAKLTAVWFTNANTGWAVGESGTLLKTVDGGDFWSADSSPTGNSLASVCFPDSTTGYVVGIGGTIIKYDVLTSVSETNTKFSPSIFPNPSNGKFKIETDQVDTTMNGNKLEIYNALGEKIYFSDFKQNESNEIDISGSPKGIYFLTIYKGIENYARKIIVQ